MKLIDSKLSGNAWKVRLLLRHLGRSFERETLNLAEGRQAQPGFGALNPFHRIPVLQLPDGSHLFESAAMLLHLAEGSDLLPADPAARAHVTGWLFFEQADLMRFLAYPRFYAMTGQTAAQAQTIAHYHEVAAQGLARGEAALSRGAWICGGGLTIADFALYPYIRLAPEGGLDLSPWPAVQAWLARFEALPQYEALAA
jgi:glutathione S-transferase